MSWPFLTIYLRQTFNLPLTLVAGILTIRSAAGLLNSFIAGPIADRFGRKWLVVLSLMICGFSFYLMSRAQSIVIWIIIMILCGAFQPVLRVGADAMIADLIPSNKRMDAYSLMRIISNLGVSIGPIIGGILAASSYSKAFLGGSLMLFGFGFFSLIFLKETLQRLSKEEQVKRGDQNYGYKVILQDKKFLSFMLMLTMTVIGAIMMFILLPVYIKEQYGLSESYFGWIIATNGLMIVIFQYPISTLTKKFSSFSILITGAVFYGLGLGSVALGSTFPMFVISMAIMTMGELLMMPTATTMTANMAPPEMRGRYMGLFNLTYTIGMGVGPIVGGLLNDFIAPVAIWYGGMVFAFLSAIGFFYLSRKFPSLNYKITG